MTTQEIKDRARDSFEGIFTDLRDLSQWMYENPETAFEEFESSRRLAGFLADHGFEVEYPAYGLETSFAARGGEDGPEVVVCAEYDALPGVGHACGHNIIATAALGAAVAVSPLLGELGCRVKVLGTPAEENRGGKVDLIEAGAFDGATAAMMIHPSPNGVVDPSALAIYHEKVTFHGKDAHASASPWEGINALDAFVQLYLSVSTFRQHMRSTDKFHGIVTKGGDAPNIIPSLVETSWYVRAADFDRLEFLQERFVEMVEAAAKSTGCTHEIERTGHPYQEIISEPLMVELYAANSVALGRPVEYAKDQPPGKAGSTDMGNVSQIVPSIHPMVKLECGSAVNHQPEFADHTVTEDGHGAMRDAALSMAWTIIDLAAEGRWDDLQPPGSA